MSKPAFTYDSATNSFRDPDGQVLVALPAPAPAPTNDLTQTIAAAFGYSPENAPDILRVGSGPRHDEHTPSQAHLDTVAAFSAEPEPRA